MTHSIPWLLTALLYTPVFVTLYQTRWEHIDYTHAYFILPISLLITYLKRHDIHRAALNQPKNVNLPGLIIFIFGCLCFIFGWRQDYLLIQTLSLIFVLNGMCLFLYGKAMLKVLAFPIFYLLLLIPPPLGILDAITLPMRHGASVLAGISLQALGYDVTRHGLLLYMGQHEIYLGEPCSGFRSLITMLALSLVYVYFLNTSIRKSLLLLAAVIPFTLLGNIVRVVALCLITYYFGKEAGEGFFHHFSGYVVFLVLIILMIAFSNLLERIKG